MYFDLLLIDLDFEIHSYFINFVDINERALFSLHFTGSGAFQVDLFFFHIIG